MTGCLEVDQHLLARRGGADLNQRDARGAGVSGRLGQALDGHGGRQSERALVVEWTPRRRQVGSGGEPDREVPVRCDPDRADLGIGVGERRTQRPHRDVEPGEAFGGVGRTQSTLHLDDLGRRRR